MNLNPMSINPENEQLYIEWLRKASVAERFAVTEQLSQIVIDETKASIRRDYPQASEEELKLIFVEIFYGKDLADRVRTHLQKRKAR